MSVHHTFENTKHYVFENTKQHIIQILDKLNDNVIENLSTSHYESKCEFEEYYENTYGVDYHIHVLLNTHNKTEWISIWQNIDEKQKIRILLSYGNDQSTPEITCC